MSGEVARGLAGSVNWLHRTEGHFWAVWGWGQSRVSGMLLPGDLAGMKRHSVSVSTVGWNSFVTLLKT